MDTVQRVVPDPQELQSLVASYVIAAVDAKAEISALDVARQLRAQNPDKEIAYVPVRETVEGIMRDVTGYGIRYGSFRTWVPIQADPAPDTIQADPVQVA